MLEPPKLNLKHKTWLPLSKIHPARQALQIATIEYLTTIYAEMSLRSARQKLQIAMGDYSQNYYAAGWMLDIEFELWDGVIKLRSGMHLSSWERHSEFLTLSVLSEVTGGWWYWGNSRIKFLPMEQWLAIYEKRRQKLLGEINQPGSKELK